MWRQHDKDSRIERLEGDQQCHHSGRRERPGEHGLVGGRAAAGGHDKQGQPPCVSIQVALT